MHELHLWSIKLNYLENDTLSVISLNFSYSSGKILSISINSYLLSVRKVVKSRHFAVEFLLNFVKKEEEPKWSPSLNYSILK